MNTIRREYQSLYNDCRDRFDSIPFEILSNRVQLLHSMYWEEINDAWNERMNLLRRRDELTAKNERLVQTLKDGQSQLDVVRLESIECKRDLEDVRREMQHEKFRNIEDKRINDKREAEIRRAQQEGQAISNRIQKRKDELVGLYYLTLGSRGRDNS